MKRWPALDVHRAGDPDLTLAAADDFAPTAVEERGETLRLFFLTASSRDAAHAALTATGRTVEPVDVDDENWAARSQADLEPVTVGRITVVQSSVISRHASVSSRLLTDDCRLTTVTIVITPSMGFGTGHHATTRLCLAALQTIDVANKTVLDVGTGSGILAIAAARLGAARALGIDNDPDAIQSAIENLSLNAEAMPVEFRTADLSASALPQADIVTANLTGALLIRSADRLMAAVRSGGTLIVSGLLAEEESAVRRAIAGEAIWRGEEDGWVCLIMSLHPKARRLV